MKYTIFGSDVFELVEGGITINGKKISLERCEEVYQQLKHTNIIHRPSGILFYQAFVKNNFSKDNFRALEV